MFLSYPVTKGHAITYFGSLKRSLLTKIKYLPLKVITLLTIHIVQAGLFIWKELQSTDYSLQHFTIYSNNNNKSLLNVTVLIALSLQGITSILFLILKLNISLFLPALFWQNSMQTGQAATQLQEFIAVLVNKNTNIFNVFL